MTVAMLERELAAVGRILARWQAELRGSWWAAGWLAALLVLGLADLTFHLGRGARLVLWIGWIGGAAAGIWYLTAPLKRRFSSDGVAARLERGFPDLDNRLINFLQFARADAPDPFVQAYLAEGLGNWHRAEVAQLRDRRTHLKARLIAAGALAALMSPLLFHPASWVNSLIRVVNPFSVRGPSTLANLVSITPGDTSVLAGRPLVLACEARGRSGQPVQLEISWSDGQEATHNLGRTAGGGTAERFAFDIARVTAPLEYRFKAADDRSRTFKVGIIPPLALGSLEAVVEPRPYMTMPASTNDVLQGPVLLPAGSRVVFSVGYNRAVKQVRIEGGKGIVVAQGESTNGASWKLVVERCTNSALRVVAADEYEGDVTKDVALQLIPDRTPLVRVISPQGSARISAGGVPRIAFAVEDDFGLSEVRVESIDPENADAAPVVLQTWTGSGDAAIERSWDGPALPRNRTSAGFRVVGLDNADPPQEGISTPILFLSESASAAAEGGRSAAKAAETLEQVIRLQRENLDRTQKLQAAPQAAAGPWGEAASAQREIREISGRLLADSTRPLGALTQSLRELHQGAMIEAADLLGRMPSAPQEQRPGWTARAVSLEEKILRVLTRVGQGVEASEKQRQVADLLAMLEALIGGQEGVLEGTQLAVKNGAKIGATLVGRQDRLAGDATEFGRVCRREAEAIVHTDADFAALVVKVADGIGQKKVPESMLLAAESLDGGKPAEAVPHEQTALAALQELRALLDQWRVADAAERGMEMRQAVGKAKEKMQKLAKLQKKLVDELRETQKQKDQSGKEYKEKMEELAELKETIEEAALQVARDLHIFPELPVGNELVEDISQIFEETKQVEGSEEEPAQEIGLQKEDFILDLLEAQTGRLDDMEMWLPSKPDNIKRLTENFDQAEMPKIPVIPLGEELQDIIGDLLEEQEDVAKKSDDSATNQGSSDLAMGWAIEEGEFANFSAKGKSGSRRPDHNEQTGRSLVGRQGQANGETTAGSGKIAAGDENIEARRTQDSAQSGQVDIKGFNDAKATGGGKLAGFDNEYGMSGAGPRRDAATAGSPLGMQALLRRNAEQVYARATLLHVRTGSMDEAILYMRRAEEAMAEGRPIQQVREFQNLAAAALKRARAELGGGFVDQGETAERGLVDDPLASSPDEAPSNYRDLVSEYFKSLSKEL
jgi:hypothetical protein